MKTIEIIVSPQGETKGYSGSECRDASKFLEQALGSRQDEQITSEFYQSHEVNQTNQQQV